MAVPALSRTDQSVRRTDRIGRPADVQAGAGRQRHVRPGPTARRAFRPVYDRSLRRRPLGGDRDGDRGIGRARDHGVERHRYAVRAAAARGTDHRARQYRWSAAYRAANGDLRHPVSRLCILSFGGRCAACLDRPAVLCGDCAARACLFRRTDLATGYRTRRVGGDDRRNPSLGLHAAAAELGGRRHRRSEPALPGPVGNRAAAPAGAHRARSATARPRRNLEPFTQCSCLCSVLAWTSAGLDRTTAGRPLRPLRPHSDPAEPSVVALLGNGRGIDRDRLPLPRRGAHTHLLRQLCLDTRHQPRSKGRGGLPAPALCRASDRVRDRRGIVPPRALASPAQAYGLDQGRAQASRRRQRRHPLQS